MRTACIVPRPRLSPRASPLTPGSSTPNPSPTHPTLALTRTPALALALPLTLTLTLTLPLPLTLTLALALTLTPNQASERQLALEAAEKAVAASAREADLLRRRLEVKHAL